jgi:hypothetical protein
VTSSVLFSSWIKQAIKIVPLIENNSEIAAGIPRCLLTCHSALTGMEKAKKTKNEVIKIASILNNL